MRKMAAAIFTVLLGLWIGCAPARAQFDAQATYVSTSGGSGTAITILLANVTNLSDLVGVPIRVLMAGSVTGPATLTVNSLAPVTISKKTTAGLQALTNGDVVNAQTAIFTYDGTVFELEGPQLNLATVPSTSGFVAPINLQINCTAAANALTCAFKAANTGGDPSALAPVYIPFADTTTTSGDPVWVTVNAAGSFTFAGGNTAGCSSGAACRLWITAINNGGTVVLGLSNQSNSTTCFPLNEAVLQTTGSGTSGGNSPGTIYTSVSALSSKAVRIVGYVEFTNLVTAGNWTSPNFVRLFGPGVKKPCDVVQTVYGTTSSTTSSSSSTFAATALSATITPTSPVNLLRVESAGNSGSTAGTNGIPFTRLYRGSCCGTLLGNGSGAIGSSNTVIVNHNNLVIDTGQSGATTYGVAFAVLNNAVTYTFLGNGSITGATGPGQIIINEIMGALEPDNDNGLPLSKVG